MKRSIWNLILQTFVTAAVVFLVLQASHWAGFYMETDRAFKGAQLQIQEAQIRCIPQ